MRARRPLNGSWDPESLVARPSIPKPQTKHHSYFEFVENKEKKKKLHFQARPHPQAWEMSPRLTWHRTLTAEIPRGDANSCQLATPS